MFLKNIISIIFLQLPLSSVWTVIYWYTEIGWQHYIHSYTTILKWPVPAEQSFSEEPENSFTILTWELFKTVETGIHLKSTKSKSLTMESGFSLLSYRSLIYSKVWELIPGKREGNICFSWLSPGLSFPLAAWKDLSLGIAWMSG